MMLHFGGLLRLLVQEGKDLYSVGLHTFEQLAKDAGAVYHIKRRVLVNTQKVDEYLENFCDSNN